MTLVADHTLYGLRVDDFCESAYRIEFPSAAIVKLLEAEPELAELHLSQRICCLCGERLAQTLRMSLKKSTKWCFLVKGNTLSWHDVIQMFCKCNLLGLHLANTYCRRGTGCISHADICDHCT